MVSHSALYVRHFKASNLQCHFSSLHANIDREFPKATELRKHKLITLKSQAEKQTQFFQTFMKQSETVTLASYQMAWNIAQSKRPYDEGEFVKNASVTLLKSCLLKQQTEKNGSSCPTVPPPCRTQNIEH